MSLGNNHKMTKNIHSPHHRHACVQLLSLLAAGGAAKLNGAETDPFSAFHVFDNIS